MGNARVYSRMLRLIYGNLARHSFEHFILFGTTRLRELLKSDSPSPNNFSYYLLPVCGIMICTL
ncbi:hypothetical protein YC2023_034473 [Brassica napus]